MSQSPPSKRIKMDDEHKDKCYLYNNKSVTIHDSQDMFSNSSDQLDQGKVTEHQNCGNLLCSSEELFQDSDESWCNSIDTAKTKSSMTWSGEPITSLNRVPHRVGAGTAQPLPPPVPSGDHTVCVQLPLLHHSHLPRPHPTLLTDVWDEAYVRLPWAKDNLYPVIEDGRKVLRSRWQLVVEAVTARPLKNSKDLEKAIMSYNTRYRDKHDWDFSGLHYLFTEDFEVEETEAFFTRTLPGMIDLLTASPSILTCPVPLLKAGKPHSITLSQHQISVILVNAFFCTYPRRNILKNNSEFSNYPMINFNVLFSKSSRRLEANLEKLKCLLAYFSVIVDTPRTGLLTFTRVVLHPRETPDWGKSTKNLGLLHLDSSGNIECEGGGMLQADFANKFIGGGVLRSGLVQEEIRFTICPELIASLLFTEAMRDNEAVVITGAEQYCDYSGYGDTFRFKGRWRDMTEVDTSNRKLTSLVAMDAIKFSKDDCKLQFNYSKVMRELNKAFVAFYSPGRSRLEAVATGNWGCGAFGGDVRLKLLLQLLAASEAGRDMAYFTFGDEELVKESGKMYQVLVDNRVTVGDLFEVIQRFIRHSQKKNGEELFRWITDFNWPPGAAGVEADQTSKFVNYQSTDESEDDSAAKALKDLASEYNTKVTAEVNVSKDIVSPEVENSDNRENNQRNQDFSSVNVLDKMEKGELLESFPDVTQQSLETPTTLKSSISKQSKMTDFLIKK